MFFFLLLIGQCGAVKLPQGVIKLAVLGAQDSQAFLIFIASFRLFSVCFVSFDYVSFLVMRSL